MSAPKLVEHFFRHEYGKLVAIISRRVGVQYVELVEDAVQFALMSAMENWALKEVPDNPSAWLYRVAHNKVLEALRQHSGRQKILDQNAFEIQKESEKEIEASLAGEVRDDLLRMLFVCCDDTLPQESQLIFALKTLCGFSVSEISQRLFLSEANAYKRLSRARTQLQSSSLNMDRILEEDFLDRLPSVHKILYLLFTEGYLSSHEEHALRLELCNEAIRLTTVLAEHPWGDSPETSALLALMFLHEARMSARQDGSGGLLLLEEQDRSLWDRGKIQQGLEWLGRSAQGDQFSRYHAEAGIAAEHCLSPSFSETRWERVVECYDLLDRVAPSSIHKLNRAVAVAEWKTPMDGLLALKGLEPPTWLEGSYMWSAVLADLHYRCGNTLAADRYKDVVFKSAPSQAIKELLEKRFK